MSGDRDIFRGKEAFEGKKLFVLDMDGTFYLGNRILEGSLKFIERLRNSGRKFLFYTNNSSRTSQSYRDKLYRMGCTVGHNEIITSGDVTIGYLQDNYPQKKVYLIGTELLAKSFSDAGINLVEDRPDIVVVGFDTALTYEKVAKACRFIRDGAKFIATHPDLNCPVEDGFVPDCGSMCAMITASTGVSPRYLGKPFRETLEYITRVTGCELDEMVFVGDRLYTDIAIGVNNGVTSILVLTGETSREDLAGSKIKPDFVFESLGSLSDVI